MCLSVFCFCREGEKISIAFDKRKENTLFIIVSDSDITVCFERKEKKQKYFEDLTFFYKDQTQCTCLKDTLQ